jgi:hypothetical protein
MSGDKPLVIPETLLIQLDGGQIEEMPLDEYLKGVVPTEMGLKKPVEALKAQAIAARTYAVVTRRHARDGFDLCATIHCQVWKPKNRYTDSDLAVDETTGQIVTFNGKIAATPFFAHCDGRTRNSEEAWSGKMPYCRTVSCICGYEQLQGHGVGMCQRGAAAMAREGATAGDILRHYYTGVEIVKADAIPRSESRRSLVLGRVVDGLGEARPGLTLVLRGSAGSFNKGTTRDGRFWFTGLPAGQWELKVKGKPVRYGDLLTDGRNTLELQVVVPDAQPLVATTIPMAYPKLLIGTVGYEGVPVTISDPSGNELTVLSGSAPDFNPGGFAVPLPPRGACTLRVLDQSFDLEIGDIGLWVRFATPSA